MIIISKFASEDSKVPVGLSVAGTLGGGVAGYTNRNKLSEGLTNLVYGKKNLEKLQRDKKINAVTTKTKHFLYDKPKALLGGIKKGWKGQVKGSAKNTLVGPGLELAQNNLPVLKAKAKNFVKNKPKDVLKGVKHNLAGVANPNKTIAALNTKSELDLLKKVNPVIKATPSQLRGMGKVLGAAGGGAVGLGAGLAGSALYKKIKGN